MDSSGLAERQKDPREGIPLPAREITSDEGKLFADHTHLCD